MDRLKIAVAEEIQELKEAAMQLPELADEYINQGWGVFRMWMNLSGYKADDENEEIAKMRDFCTDWK